MCFVGVTVTVTQIFMWQSPTCHATTVTVTITNINIYNICPILCWDDRYFTYTDKMEKSSKNKLTRWKNPVIVKENQIKNGSTMEFSRKIGFKIERRKGERYEWWRNKGTVCGVYRKNEWCS